MAPRGGTGAERKDGEQFGGGDAGQERGLARATFIGERLMVLSSLPFSKRSRSHIVDTTGLSLVGATVGPSRSVSRRVATRGNCDFCIIIASINAYGARRNNSCAAQIEGWRSEANKQVDFGFGQHCMVAALDLYELRRRQAKNQIRVHSAGKTYKWRSAESQNPISPHTLLSNPYNNMSPVCTYIPLPPPVQSPCPSHYLHLPTSSRPLLLRSPRTPLTRRVAAQAPATVAISACMHPIC